MGLGNHPFAYSFPEGLDVLCHFHCPSFFVGLFSLDVVFFNPLAVYVLMDVAFVLNSFNS